MRFFRMILRLILRLNQCRDCGKMIGTNADNCRECAAFEENRVTYTP